MLCLVDQAPQLVRRQNLFRILWPGDTHGDFDGNLNAIVRDLRELLGDSARNPRYIETEPRRGYRFIAPVAEVMNTPPGAPEDAATPPPAVMRKHDPGFLRTSWFLAMAAIGLAIGGLILWRGQTRTRDASSPQRIVQLTSLAGRAGHASFSPDGSKIAFHWDGNEQGGFDIYVRKLGSEQFQRLTHDPADDLFPAWSSDGRDVAFLRRFTDGRCAIYLVPSNGGSERLIKTVPTETPLSWSPDGRWIAYSVIFLAAQRASSPEFGIYAVSLLSGQVKRLSDAGREWLGDQDGVFSPDGRQLAFFRSFSTGVSELYIQAVDERMERRGPPRRITFEGQNSSNPVWTPDGKEIIFSSLRGGERSLWQVSAANPGAPREVGGEDALEPEIDRQGRRIVYERTIISDTLQILSLCSPEGSCISGHPRRLMYSREVARNPSWSPDGRRIAFESYANGQVQVWLSNSDGSNPMPLSSFHSTVTGTPRWSPNSKELVLDSRISGHSKIFLMNADTRGIRQLTTGTSEDVTPNFSHDGQTVYFASNRSGEFQVWKLDLATGLAMQVTRQGAFYPVESVDAKTLYYAKGMQRTEIGEVPLNGGEESTVVDSLDYWPNFVVGPVGIYFVPAHVEHHVVPIRLYRFADRKEVPIADVPGINAQGMALALDGRQLLLSVRSSVVTNLMAIERALGRSNN